MPKRKRSHNEPEVIDGNPGPLPDRALGIREKQVEQKIAVGKKALNKALKLAKGFERQKLGKRLKAARAEGDEADAARLASEVEVLKALNLPRLAEVHIYKTLAKSKPISFSLAFPQWVLTTAKAIQTDEHGRKTEKIMAKNNVTARLYNSNPVKEAMADILKAVQTSLGQENIRNCGNQKVKKAQKGGKALASSSGHLASNGSLVGEYASTTIEPGVKVNGRSPSDKALHVFSSEDEQEGPGISKYDRIAGTEDEENNFSCDGGNDKGMAHGRGGVSPRVFNPEAGLSLSPPPSERPSSSPSPLKSQKQKISSPVPKSTFLPSLMGGYWSGSESAEEDENTGLQPRKNRMGQRARRQLWEKKFGIKANHLRGAVGDKDWHSSRGAKTIDKRGVPRPTRDGFRGINVATKYTRTGDELGERSSERSRLLVKLKEGPLHPSWEAAKRAKRQGMQATFQGKKIVFD